jgi:hypothetical protein
MSQAESESTTPLTAARLYARMARAVDSLLTAMEELFPDTELEGDERGRCLDLEQDDADLKPSLGATEHMNQNVAWRVTYEQKAMPDCEVDAADHEGQVDDGPIDDPRE